MCNKCEILDESFLMQVLATGHFLYVLFHFGESSDFKIALPTPDIRVAVLNEMFLFHLYAKSTSLSLSLYLSLSLSFSLSLSLSLATAANTDRNWRLSK